MLSIKKLKLVLFSILFCICSINSYANNNLIPIMVGDILIFIPVINDVVYIDDSGNLYLKTDDDKFLKLTQNSSGEWSVTELTQAQWNAVNLTESNYTLTFDTSGQEITMRLNNKALNTSIAVRYAPGGYQIIPPIVIGYKYDALGRLTFVQDADNGNRDYDYDAAGNRINVANNTENDDDSEPHIPIPAAPTELNCSSYYGSSFYASWSSVEGADHYIVYYNGAPINVSATHKILSPNSSGSSVCNFSVKACNSADECSAFSHN